MPGGIHYPNGKIVPVVNDNFFFCIWILQSFAISTYTRIEKDQSVSPIIWILIMYKLVQRLFPLETLTNWYCVIWKKMPHPFTLPLIWCPPILHFVPATLVLQGLIFHHKSVLKHLMTSKCAKIPLLNRQSFTYTVLWDYKKTPMICILKTFLLL